MLQAVADIVVIVAADVADMLRGSCTPSLGVCYLRMLNATYKTKLNSLLVTCYAVNEATCREVELAAQTVTNIVRECTYARHLICVALEGELRLVIQGICCSPTLAVEQD